MTDVLLRLRALCQATKTLKESEAQELYKLVEVLKPFLQTECTRVVRQAAGLPVLRSYSSDTTPVKVKTALPTPPSSSAVPSRRVGSKTFDLLTQVAFVRSQTATGEIQTAVCTRDPVPVHSKSGWCLFEAASHFQPTLRNMSHCGIAIEHVVADRAEQSVLARHMKELLLRQHQDLPKAALPPGGLLELVNKQWFLSNACACHDGHNSLKWAISKFMQKDALRAVFATTRALRSSYVFLAQHLGSWMLSSVRFQLSPYGPPILHQVWTLLGLESSLVDTLVEVGAHCHDGHLCVSPNSRADASLMEKLSGVLLSVLAMKQFTESRWLTVGCSMRSLTAAALLGLDGLLEHTLAVPHAPLYHLSGAKRFVGEARAFAVMAGICSFIGDSFIADVLEDNRIPRRIGELEELLHSEMEFIMTLPLEAFSMVGSACAFSGSQLRDEVVAACLAAYSYIQDKTIIPAKHLPWSLCAGNVHNNLLTLKDLQEPLEPTSCKVHRLLHQGCNLNELIMAVNLIGDCPWTTTVCEQLHGSVSLIHRQHPDYELNMLVARSFLHMLRSLPSMAAEELQVQKLQSELRQCTDQRVDSFGGRQVFFADLSRGASLRRLQDRFLPVDAWRLIMREHAGRYDALPHRSKAMLQARAQLLQAEKRQEALDRRIALVAELRLAQSRRDRMKN